MNTINKQQIRDTMNNWIDLISYRKEKPVKESVHTIGANQKCSLGEVPERESFVQMLYKLQDTRNHTVRKHQYVAKRSCIGLKEKP